MSLGDCTFMYVVLRNTRFERIAINAESLGAILGVTRNQLLDSRLVYLGQEQPIPAADDLVKLVSEQYRLRKWYWGELVLALNYDLQSTIGAFDSYLKKAHVQFLQLSFVRGDELAFVGDILDELAFLNRLSLLTTVAIKQWCESLELALRPSTPQGTSGSVDSLRSLATKAAFLTAQLLDRVEHDLSPALASACDESIYLRATFEARPNVRLTDLLNSLTTQTTLEIAHASAFMHEETGSYIEVVYTTIFSVVALQVLLYLINGCIIQITELKQRIKVLARTDAPKKYADMALGPAQTTSPLMLSLLQGIAKHAKGLPWIGSADLAGMSSRNLKVLEIRSANVNQSSHDRE